MDVVRNPEHAGLNVERLPFETLPSDHVRRLGLIVLQSDVTLEDELRHYYEGVPLSLLASRIPFANEVTASTLKAMEGHLAQSMSLFPLDATFDCIGYGCTSGAMHIGSERIVTICRSVRQSTAGTDPLRAARAAMQRLNVRRVALIAPYSEAVTRTMVEAFESLGIGVSVAATFNEPQDRLVGRIAPASIRAACIEVAKAGDVDALFVACTSLKCAAVIPEVERATGVTMLSSNQVLAWHMAELAGIQHGISAKGRLFEQ